MASTLEIFLASLALGVNTFLLILMAFLQNLILPPILGLMETMTITPLPLPVGDVTFVVPFIFAVLLLFEIMCVIAFFATIARRNTVEDWV